MKLGQIVKYSNPMNAQEAELQFIVIENRETRLLVELITDQMELKPQFCYAIEEFELVKP